MRRVWTLGGGLATAASLGIAALALRPASSPARAAIPTTPPEAMAPASAFVQGGRFAPQGVGSCAASACHGSGTSLSSFSPVRRNEHTTWITDDPHSSAYDVLTGERSERIARNLGRAGKNYVAAPEDARCLACHATPSAALADPLLVDTIRRDGVGCESCHGASSSWLAEHTRWGPGNREEKAQRFNFTNLRDLETLAQTCAGCHVGAPADPSLGIPARDVNHDLIAAGHPRLNWEFSAYVANYPKHWDPKDEQGRRYTQLPPDWDARLWKVGQVASLRASVDLLHDRAERASAGQAPWPEFSEYGCFSCHFALKEKPFRGPRARESPWGPPTGHRGIFRPCRYLRRPPPRDRATEAEARLGDLRKTMQRLKTDPKAVSTEAASARSALDAWLAGLSRRPLDRGEVDAIARGLQARTPEGGYTLVKGWDSAAAQLYLALAAAHASLRAQGQADPTLKAELDRLLEQLRFARGLDSPRAFDPSEVK